MAYSPSHRTNMSLSSSAYGLQSLPTGSQKQQRRMTAPSITPNASLNLPDGHQQPKRPPSPLRNGFIPDTSTGIHPDFESDEEDNDEDRHWGRSSPSPSASSVSQLASNFAQRVGTLVSNIGHSRSPGAMPTEAEIEAEAEREREHSRREAERILSMEAEQRRTVEERVLAMMHSTRSNTSLPLPPPRSQTLPTPSPTSSQKESSSWWTAAKNKLTPTKEPLTPAQQIIQETKAKEKEKKSKGKEKEKDREKEWPATPDGKYNDPAFLNLNVPVAPPQRRPVPSIPSTASLSSPSTSSRHDPNPLTPPRFPQASFTPSFTPSPSPSRGGDSAAGSPSSAAPPLYAQFSSTGTLDVPGTLLLIAKRFEKLEKWTVGHVRALEERMGDVERWLVDKEKEREEQQAQTELSNAGYPSREVTEIRSEIAELQGRVGELGREMAKMATAPANLSSGPSRQPQQVAPATQTTSSFASPIHSASASPISTPMAVSPPPHTRIASSTAFESTSPPMASSRTSSRTTRLPYPTGDYASPPPSTHSPNSSMDSNAAQGGISGLPPTGLSTPGAFSGSNGLPRASSPLALVPSPSSTASGLPVPSKPHTQRSTSISPTPRKRYTVALGGPITAPVELSQPQQQKRRNYAASPVGMSSEEESANEYDDAREDDDESRQNGFDEETIGKSAAARLVMSASSSDSKPRSNGYNNVNGNGSTSTPSGSSPSNNRVRAQSAYGFSSVQGASTSFQNQLSAASTPTNNNLTNSSNNNHSRYRSRSTDRFGLGISGLDTTANNKMAAGDYTSYKGSSSPMTPLSGKFVDPLVLRKQEKEKDKGKEREIAMPVPGRGKVPIGQLVKFFDGERGRE